MDNLSKLPVDLFINQITYLPFSDVINICNTNKTFHEYCTNPRYSVRWRSLINNTFGNIYNYQEKLKQIQDKLKINGYNYLIYTQLIKILDPITQAMIYYQQNDISFNKFGQEEKFLALFLLNKRNIIEQYIIEYDEDGDYRGDWYQRFIDFMDKKKRSQNDLNTMLRNMADHGNVKGVIMFEKLGGDIHEAGNFPLILASHNGHLDVVKYLVEHGVNIKTLNESLHLAARNGHLNIVKYLIENGADVNSASRHTLEDNYALLVAAKNGHLNIVKYLVSIGNYDSSTLDEAHSDAQENSQKEVMDFLESLP